MVLVALAAPLAVLAVACSGPDNPKPADVPQITIKPETKAQDIPTRQAPTYGASKKYQDSMDKINK